MKSIVADTILESSDEKFTYHSVRKTVVSKLKKANVDRLWIAKVTGHKNIQSLNDYDEANEDEQRQLSYSISGRNNVNPQPTVSRAVMTNNSRLRLQLNFFNRRERECHCNRFRYPIGV